MLPKKVGESLTARIFFLTALILLCAGGVTFGLVAWATPSTYTAVVTEDLTAQVDELAQRLRGTEVEDCGPALDAFIRSSGAEAMLVGPDGRIADTGSQLAVQAVYEDDTMVVTESEYTLSMEGDEIAWSSGGGGAVEQVAFTAAQGQVTATTEVYFAGQEEPYLLYVTPRMEAENLAVRALVQMAPWLLLVLLVFSLLCALVYSRYITRPIVQLSGIAGKMAELDFHWTCGEQRRDEIGRLGRSLNQMARRLSASLQELERANHALRGEVERERELDRQRMAFFSAASHELKTPVTILKGQLSGMLEGVGVYQDRDKYLLRSLQVTGRMEALIQEMLAIARMESGRAPMRWERIELSQWLKERLALDAELLQQRGLHLASALTPGAAVTGDRSLLDKAVGNLLSNAALYSPEGAEVRVWCGEMQGCPALTVENTGAHIREEALPHLFEAFYREENSRNRSTGGSGLGLYLVKIILERHKADCRIENTQEGVKVTVRFPIQRQL